MKRLLSICALMFVLISPLQANAQPVTITTTMANYSGDGAYLVLYVTDANGVYKGTLWVSGKKRKYYKHFRSWRRLTSGGEKIADAFSGASTHSNRKLQVKLNLADSVFTSGYILHIDTSVEDKRDVAKEVSIELKHENAGIQFAGNTYIDNVTFSLQ